MRSCLATILCWVIVMTANGQQFLKIDSLNRITESYRYSQSDSVIKYAKITLALSQKSNYAQGLFNSHSNLCFGYYLKSVNDSSDYHGDEALKISNGNWKIYNLAETHIFIGLNKMSQGIHHEAIFNFQEAIKVATQTNNNTALADASSNIGLAYINTKNYQKARQYYKAALKVHDIIDHPHGEVYILHNLGRIYFDLQYYDSASYYLTSTIDLAKEIGDKRANYYALSLLGQIPQIDTEVMEQHLTEALKLSYELNMIRPIMDNHLMLADFHLNQTEYRLAIQHAKNAITAADDGNYDVKKRGYAALVKAYSSLGDIDASKKYVDKYEESLDSLKNYNLEHASGVFEINELVDEERNIENLRSDLKRKEERERLKNFVIILGSIAIILAIVIIFILYIAVQKRKRSADELLKLNKQLDLAMKEKDLILGMVVHDLKSPLDKIHGLTELLKSNAHLKADDQEMLDLMLQIILNSKTLTSELLEANQLETGKYLVKSDLIELKSFVESILFHFENDAGKKGIDLIPSLDLQKGIIRSDKSVIQRILENLLTNAIKFNHMNGEVFVDIKSTDNSLNITVRDTGPGIPKTEHDKLFQKFSRTSTQPTAKESSTGLGLYIVKHLVNNLSGSITVHSDVDQGAEFIVQLPIN